jgi:hypothetical protein
MATAQGNDHSQSLLGRIADALEAVGSALRGQPQDRFGRVDFGIFCPVALMHLPGERALASTVILDPDPPAGRSREAAERVVEAYHAAMREPVVASPSMWTGVEVQQAAFVAALRDRDISTIQQMLARLFHTSLIWGLGRVHPDTPLHVRAGQTEGLQIQVTDALVSLAEATGVARVTCIEQQGVEAHLAALKINPAELLDDLVYLTRLEVGMPEVGQNYGCLIGGRKVSIDTLVHAYTAYRLDQLGIERHERVVEIGGGYGCLAYVCRLNGFSDYTIVDLPWVNVIQGYVLIMSLPPGSVSLFGEPDAAVKVRPFWEFGRLPDRSVDVVVNTDSLPEIGEATGRQYINDIARVIRKYFLSINQEAMMEYPGVGYQLHVNGLAAEEPRLRLQHRQRYWMRQGYVEEVFAPVRPRRPGRSHGSA